VRPLTRVSNFSTKERMMTYKEALMQSLALAANVMLVTTVVYNTWKLNKWLDGSSR
jgi:hypothetical protein